MPASRAGRPPAPSPAARRAVPASRAGRPPALPARAGTGRALGTSAGPTEAAGGGSEAFAPLLGGGRGHGQAVHQVVERVAPWPFTQRKCKRPGELRYRSTRGSHRSRLATFCLAAPTQPRATHLSHQPSRKQLTT